MGFQLIKEVNKKDKKIEGVRLTINVKKTLVVVLYMYFNPYL